MPLLILPPSASSFVSSFRDDAAHNALVNSLAIGPQQLETFLACFLAWPITNRYARRTTLALASATFETADTHAIGTSYSGPSSPGIGLGAAMVVGPMYSSEMTPKHLRGQLGSFSQLNLTVALPARRPCNVRGSESEEAADEMKEIRTGVEIEARETENFQDKATSA
ncbi:hypothetical protein BU23DRAFT_575817 [Bimuria novae-zelandiae CBS 107.79]|uniref:Uncharacterized protein n=1 Tax=Bimuria novae-zelandiae CBS 107.79 TaxID=1447943 RepID=A0A6A5UKI1_9PLEO|nr:hypothetical protein BU23DRAFT_575817 [Bimuria novae-zelandiae CBS 107.79]